MVEPLLTAMQGLLKSNLPAVVALANTNITDGFLIDPPAQYLDYAAGAAELQGGMPIIVVSETPESSVFRDDLQSTVDAEFDYAIGIIIQQADHETLVKQLRRLLVCVLYVIQQDRLANVDSVMRQAGAFSVNLQRVEPGPLLAGSDLQAPAVPPNAWLSWTTLIVSSRVNEQT